jgi:hypothetical protein
MLHPGKKTKTQEYMLQLEMKHIVTGRYILCLETVHILIGGYTLRSGTEQTI